MVRRALNTEGCTASDARRVSAAGAPGAALPHAVEDAEDEEDDRDDEEEQGEAVEPERYGNSREKDPGGSRPVRNKQ